MRDRQQAGNGFKESALARPVRAEYAHQRARSDIEGDSRQRDVSATLDRHVLDRYAKIGNSHGHP